MTTNIDEETTQALKDAGVYGLAVIRIGGALTVADSTISGTQTMRIFQDAEAVIAAVVHEGYRPAKKE